MDKRSKLPHHKPAESPRGAPMQKEIVTGGIVGMIAATLIAGSFSQTVSAMIIGLGLGLVLGSFIGLLLWLGSTAFPDDRITPTARSDASSDDCHRRQR